jgi:glycosyltransferase involved in cell wall biosynthesis
MNESPRIAFAWNGLPAYGARLIRAAQEAFDEPIAVLGTRPAVAVKDVDSILGSPIRWIDGDRPIRWSELGLRPPELFIESSWATPAFNALTREVKLSGGKVVAMVDNRWKNNLRQWLGAVYFRLRLRGLYDAAWVPGASTRQFCRKLGLPDARIYDRLYSGWTERFPAGPPLDERPQRMLFVGQYIHRKGLDLLVDAWRRFSADEPDWQLELFGSGELQPLLERELPGAAIRPFEQTDEISAAMRAARFFVLPAREDHWPLVVHESASSGCGLVLSTNIGNARELASPRNAILFPSGDAGALYSALREAAGKDAAWLRAAGDESRRLAGDFGPDKFASTFRRICADLLSQ